MYFSDYETKPRKGERDTDLVIDDANALIEAKKDLLGLFQRVERLMDNGTLFKVSYKDIADMKAQMEECIDEVLAPAYFRLADEGISADMPSRIPSTIDLGCDAIQRAANKCECEQTANKPTTGELLLQSMNRDLSSTIINTRRE